MTFHCEDASPGHPLAMRLLCNICGGKQVIQLFKTNWVEIDLPVQEEKVLMTLFQRVRALLPGVPFYLSLTSDQICFAADSFKVFLTPNTLGTNPNKEPWSRFEGRVQGQGKWVF